MGVFTIFNKWNLNFLLLAYLFCLLGRALNIFPLSWFSNLGRKSQCCRITFRMQAVLWFSGLRGAIAFALSENMPGPNRNTYRTATLSICFVTTVICGGFTDRVLTNLGMKEFNSNTCEDRDVLNVANIDLSSTTPAEFGHVYKDLKDIWKLLDEKYLKACFGGSSCTNNMSTENRSLLHYEMQKIGET